MECLRNGFEHGKLLGDRFLTVSPLNHGSFGMVFAAKDTLTGANVAIKCITKPGAAKDNTACPASIAIDDRSEELEIHSRLSQHPNIVNLIHCFETESHQYMVLELCGNGDLYEAIRLQRGPLETEHVRGCMLELVAAVDHLHTSGVYHRDIKPENIFLTADGSMKLGDFGLATTDTWSTEFAVGSDRYMAPEQFDASVYGYGYSPASADVWAIGIVLLNVLFQRNPFATPTQKDPLFADFARDRQSLFDVFPNMSQDTYNVLVHSLALDPANRSLAAVRDAIKAVVTFTTDDESLDDFCTADPTPLASVNTATREPLRTPSITNPIDSGDSFPWASPLLKTPQKAERQLSTIRDVEAREEEPELYPGSVKSEWQYVDTDEASLSSNFDSGLGMSCKSTKSAKSVSTKATSNFVGSLPISFARPANKTSPYGATSSAFSKSWSDLWDEEEEMGNAAPRSSFEDCSSIQRTGTAKPNISYLDAVREEDRGSMTPRAGLTEVDANTRATTPLARLIEQDKKHPESPKQRSASIMDRWAALGNLRRARVEASAATALPPLQKTKYADVFATFTSLASSKKQKPLPKTRDRAASWRHASPYALRSHVTHSNVNLRERKDHSPTAYLHERNHEAWSLDNDWRKHMSPVVVKGALLPPLLPSHAAAPQAPEWHRKPETSLYDLELDETPSDVEWVGNFRDFEV